MTASLKQLSKDPNCEAVSRHDSFAVDPKAIKFRDGFNLRQAGPELEAHIQRIKQALIAGADVPPIDVVVENGEIIAIDGHCRTMAALLAIDEGTPIRLDARHFRGDERAQTLHMLGTGTGSLHLTPLQNGHGFMRLVKQMKMTEKEIAAALGVSVQTVKNGLELAEAPLDVQDALAAGSVTAKAAKQAVRKHGKKAGAVIKQELAASGGKKVKTKSVPKGAADSFYAVAGQIRDHVNADIEEAAALAGGKHVQVPAKLLRDLFKVYDGVKK